MSRHCTTCGTINVDENSYCISCGGVLGAPVAMPDPSMGGALHAPPGYPQTPVPPTAPALYAPPAGGPGPYQPVSPYVPANLGWVSDAGRIIMADPWSYALYYFLMFMVAFIAMLVPTFPFIPALIALDRDALLGSALFLLLALGLFCLVLLLQPILTLGMSLSALRQSRYGEPLQVGKSLSGGWAHLVQGILLMLLLTLVSGSLSCLSTFCNCAAPLIVLAYYLLVTPIQLAYMRLVDGAPNAWSALSDGVAVVQQDYVGYLLLGLIVSTISTLGFLVCGVGIFFTAPIIYVTYTLAYRANFERPPTG